MKSFSVIVVTLLLTIVSTTIVQAGENECTCGGLGSGTSPCSCEEVVVNAAETFKPLRYASPRAINQAAAMRESGGLTQLTNGNSNPASAFSVVGTSNIKGSNTMVTGSTGNSCGCGREKTTGPLEAATLLALNSNTQIVPSFPAIGDLCYPSEKDRTGADIRTITKVTPAYPGRLKCCENSKMPYQECVDLLYRAFGADFGINANSAISNSKSYDANNMRQLSNFGTSGASIASNVFGSSNAAASYLNEFGGGTSIISGRQNDASAFGRAYGESSSDWFDTRNDQQHQAQLPADPVSLTLAYKNIIAPSIYSRNGKKHISEDRLSFGHRTVPIDANNQKMTPTIPEEKLLTVDKPVIELKINPSKSTMLMSDINQEEENLEELEALELENFEQQKRTKSVASAFISYGDLGYAPVASKMQQASDSIVRNNMEKFEEGPPCGPLGPPVPGYVPGNVIIEREVVESPETREEVDIYYNGDDDEEDDIDYPRSGMLSRLRGVARKYEKPMCGH